mgnify:CR=1 FL=1
MILIRIKRETRKYFWIANKKSVADQCYRILVPDGAPHQADSLFTALCFLFTDRDKSQGSVKLQRPRIKGAQVHFTCHSANARQSRSKLKDILIECLADPCPARPVIHHNAVQNRPQKYPAE